MEAWEANFDALVGPTHHCGGLSVGNLASQQHAGGVSNPRAAALQGLAKMKALVDRGFLQAVLPPQERPAIAVLRRLGFAGSDAAILAAARREAPALLSQVSSASSMWAANAATVSPSADTADGRVHLTPANLCSHLHRAIETPATARILQAVFPEGTHFAHHAPLPACTTLGDEGAANHSRLCADHGAPGVELFVYGREGGGEASARFPARQTRAASEAVARLHGLAPHRTVFAQQHPAAIDAGVFHNDVIAVAHRNLLLFHEHAFVDTPRVLDAVQAALGETPLVTIPVPASALSLSEAVASYLFNSQLLSRPDGRYLLVLPEECIRHDRVRVMLDDLLASKGPIAETLSFDLRQSMHNGGGPACLRLRVVLNAAERAAVLPGVWLDEARYGELVAWVERYYRDRVCVDDLADPALLDEGRCALDALCTLLGLGAIYPFQQ